ncbi:NXPE family member 1-like [Hyperolius riggenbachi]|uniref:NXPE family member 1-like n=1 Tax=Hyperolius riggenbachi TaxID=752182 RepID=UPI0035A2FC91
MAIAIESSLIDQQITKLMTLINSTISYAEVKYLNETTSAKNSTATILNYRTKYCVGDTLTFRVEMFNYLGERKSYGGDFLRARIFSPELRAAASGRIEDLHNGSYDVHFTLFWKGRVQISILLMHPSEGVTVLWKNRNIGYRYIKYTGKFLNNSKEVLTDCGLYLNSQKEVCEYADKKYGEVFYCIKQPGVPCEAFIALRIGNHLPSYLTRLEKSLFTRSNIANEIHKTVASIDVFECSKANINVTSKCKTGMSPPFPSGYFLQDQWFPTHCNLSSFKPLSHIQKCLSGKMIYLMGDSTMRQWIEFFPKVLTDLKFYDNHVIGIHKTFLAFDLQNNIYVQWKRHGHPFITPTFYPVRDHSYVPNEIDRLAGGSNTIIVITLGQHFRSSPLPLYIRRLLNVRKALEDLFLRSPDTKVFIKSENTREISLDIERFSDYHGYIQYLICKRIFRDLNVGLIDAWDMSIAFNSNNLHPPQVVVKNQINLFLSYIC